MQWEILVAVIIVIGICAAVMEARAKRIARKSGTKTVQSKGLGDAEERENQHRQVKG